MTTVLVHGPRDQLEAHADLLLAAFGCQEAIVGWSPEEPIRPGCLHLTTQRPTFEPSALVAIYTMQGALAFAEGHGFRA